MARKYKNLPIMGDIGPEEAATQYLSKEVSEGFEKIFDRVLFKTMNRNNIDSDPSLDKPKETK